MKTFLEFGKRSFNAEKNFLIVWNHGNGWYGDGKETEQENYKKSIGFDDSEKDWLNLYELEEAVESYGQKWDMIIFDACLMNTIEVIYQLRDHTEYILGSPEEIPMSGFDYEKLIKSILENRKISDTGIKIIKEAVEEFEKKDLFAVYSLIKTECIKELFLELQQCSMEMLKKLEEIKGLKSYLKENLLTYSFEENDYTLYTEIADMGCFFSEIRENNIIKKLNNVVVFKKSTTAEPEMKLEKSSGLSIYLPFEVYNTSYGLVTEFGKNNKWISFIKEFSNIENETIMD